jgi:hypothetical protein
MDPRLVKGLTMLVAVALYVGAQWLPGDIAGHIREAATLLIGWQGLRRPGDLEHIPEDAI